MANHIEGQAAARRFRKRWNVVLVSFGPLLLVPTGCGGTQPAELRLTLSSDSGNEIVVTPSSGDGGAGLFGSSSVQAEFFVVQRNRQEVDLSGSEVFLSSEFAVNKALQEVRAEHAEQMHRLGVELSDAEEQQAILESELAEARSRVANEYNKTKVTSPSKSSRRASDLRNLLAASEQKAKVDSKFRELFQQYVAPVESRLDETRARISTVQSKMNRLRITLPDRLFAALPESQATRFITDQNGKVRLKYSDQTTAVVWCEEERLVFNTTERYRWLLRVPDDLDGSGKLMFTNATMLAGGSSQLMRYGSGAPGSNIDGLNGAK